jgi:SAM-dependent methyltransferase
MHCGYEGSDLAPTINVASAHLSIDEASRESGLHDLRVHNFAELLVQIRRAQPNGGRLLEVGCAHGWFLELAKDAFDVCGIEPDERIFREAAAMGLPVRAGYFPDALAAGETYDVIVFNDVFEHIPAIDDILSSCHSHLERDGLIVLNLPSSDGIFYRLARVLCRIGACGTFDRLWQAGLPSPHVHYFNPMNLRTLLRKHGFAPEAEGTLATLLLKGLYARIAYTGKYKPPARALLFAGIASTLPLLTILPRDIIYSIARKSAGAPAKRGIDE